jgi:hypothetical protein
MSNMPRLRLQKEHEVAVFLCFVVIREYALLHVAGILEVVCDFILLF